MKKSLFISALVAFVMMFCVNVNAQEKATGKAYKDLKKQEKVLDKELQKKAIKEARKEAMEHIKKFCDERNFHIYYVRNWNTKVGETPMTCFDVGSHTEFFYTDRLVMDS